MSKRHSKRYGKAHEIPSRPLACLLLSTVALAQAVEPINILGLPLGAKLKMLIRLCAAEEGNAEVTSLVSVERDDTLSAFSFHMPRADDVTDIVKSVSESFGRACRAELLLQTGCDMAFTLADRGAGTQRYYDGPHKEVSHPESPTKR